MEETSKEETLLQRLYEQASDHLETRWEYFTLNATEKVSGLAANIAGAFVVMVFAVLVLFFFTLGFSWWLGDLLGNRAGGFALTGLIFIPLAALVFRWIRPFVRTKVIQAILQNEPTDDPADNHV
jgi:hypothetical protein